MSRRGRRSLLVFPRTAQALLLAQVLGCSHYFMTSLALFSLSRSLSSSPSPSPSPSLRPHPHPYRPHLPSLTSHPPPPDIIQHSPPPLFLLRAIVPDTHLTTPKTGHKSRTCPPQPPISLSTTRLPLHVPSAPPNRLFHWKRSRPTCCGLPLSSPTSPPACLLHKSASPPSPRRSTRTYSTVKHTYNTLRSNRSNKYETRIVSFLVQFQ